MSLKNNRIISGILSAAMAINNIPMLDSNAEENTGIYPYTLFAASTENGAITVDASNFSVNGNIATNGTIVANDNMNINGIKKEQTEEPMIFILDKIDTRYFSGSNIDEYENDYILEELNINVNEPTEVRGDATLTGNININSGLKALEDVNLYGEVKNTNDSVIFSKYGDIVIESQNVNLNGLVYAPFGSVKISAQNLNLNSVVIIAQSIVLTCPNVNANNSSSMSSFVGNKSEDLDIPYDEWEYMKDENENGLPDFFEDVNNWYLLKDTDGDKLPDCVEIFIGSEPLNIDTDNDGIDDYYEVFVLFTDPSLDDSDGNGINDDNEDFDEDLLINRQEYILKTDPWSNDSDDDAINDNDEINNYHTDPLNKDTDNDGLEDNDEFLFNTDPNDPDTNKNGVLDGDEKYPQTFTYTVENKDCAVEEVIISMSGTGNIQKNTSVESIMNKDMICSDVVGLVGEPFEIETESQFDNATLSFKINRNKLVDTDFDDLMFLWYDEENYQFVELETFYDDTNSIVSINTTHFSRYMVVDKNKWFEAWTQTFNYNPAKNGAYGAPTYKYNTVMAIDCSGSMDSYDIIHTNNVASLSDSLYHAKTCHRIEAVENFVSNMNSVDKAAIVLFTNTATIETQMTDNANELFLAAQKITNSGGTRFYAALTKSYDAFEESSLYSNNTYNRIILLSDGQEGDYRTTIQLLNSIYGKNSTDKRKSIKIYTIGLGTSYDSNLKEIARISGGEFIEAYTAEELVDIYANNGFDSDFDTTDTDGDGLYDAVEAAGIRIQNGQIIRGCDPTKKDTDNDGLADGQEIDSTIHTYESSTFSFIFKELKMKPYYFVMKSNPTTIDSDDDGIPDKYVERTMSDKVDFTFDDPNPLESDINRIALKRDLFQVQIKNDSPDDCAYGGAQGWFRGDSYDYCNGKVGGNDIKEYGCGLIAMCNVLLYLGIENETFRNWSEYIDKPTNTISKNDYMSFVKKMSNYFILRGSLGVPAELPFNLLSGSLEEGFNLLSEEYDWDLDSEWASESNSDDVYCTIKSMLKNDIPVILAYSADVNNALKKASESNITKILGSIVFGPIIGIGVPTIYDKTHEYKSLELYKFEDNKFKEDQDIKSHYVTVTEIIEFSDSIQEKLDCGKNMLKISSWGRTLYINYDEYKNDIGSFTNILEIS